VSSAGLTGATVRGPGSARATSSYRTHADDLDDGLFVLRHVVVMAVGRFIHESAGFDRRHRLRLVDVGGRARGHVPRALQHGDVPCLVVEVGAAAGVRGPRDALDVNARLARVADDRDRPSALGRLDVLRRGNEEAMRVGLEGLARRHLTRDDQRDNTQTDPPHRP